MNIPFNELRSGYLAYQTEIDAAVQAVVTQLVARTGGRLRV